MLLIKCTGKLQKEMGLIKSDLLVKESNDSLLGDWHANLIYIDRKKCILFVNDKTLFNFIAPDVPRAQIKELGGLFKHYLQCVLAEEGFTEQIIQSILSEYVEIGYAKTNSKKVLGSMNDLAFHYAHSIIQEGGVHSYTLPSIIKQLNRMPMKTINYCFPINLLRNLYGFEKINFLQNILNS